MTGDALPFDVPAAFGRFRVLHQIGAGSLGPVFRGEDSIDGRAVAIKVLQLDLPPERQAEVVEGLRALEGRWPAETAIAPVLDAGSEQDHPYVVSALASGQTLDIALRQFGPAAIADALPRLAALAVSLDLASVSATWHGGLHPRDILIDDDRSTVTGLGIARVVERAGVRLRTRRPYTPPEVLAGRRSSPEGDQYALAAIAYEWLFGRRIRGPADAPVDLPALPGVDRHALSDAFTRALAIDPTGRFESCSQFVTAVAAAVRDGMAADGNGDAQLGPEPVESGMPLLRADEAQAAPAVVQAPVETPRPSRADHVESMEAPGTRPDTPPIPAPRANQVEGGLTLTAPAEPPAAIEPVRGRLAPIAPRARPAPAFVDAPTQAVAWQGQLGASASPQGDRRAFAGGALTATLLVGLIAGAGIGVAVGDRLPFPVPFRSSAADADGATAPDAAGRGYTDAALPRGSDPPPPAEAPANPPDPTEREPADSARASRDVASTPELGRLLVRSSPAGAEVLVNGTRRGMTPVAVRDLALGTHTVVLTLPGYERAEHRITLTETRPSRSLEARLVTPAAAPSPSVIVDPSIRVDEARAATGSLLVETRPAGARAIVNGRDAGVTPLTLEALAPGVYTIRFEREGYQPWETSVRIDAGARARVAASLVGGGQRE